MKPVLSTIFLLSVAMNVAATNLTDAECIAAAVVLESRGQPFNHQLAIAQLIKHRAELKGITSCQVVSEKGQFVAYSHKLALTLKHKNSGDWQDAIAITKLSYNHRTPCKGATHFMNKGIPHASSKYDQVCVIGVHKFLKEKKSATVSNR
jgi:spore germination cell wall hydrolase CwlJ-like protein